MTGKPVAEASLATASCEARGIQRAANDDAAAGAGYPLGQSRQLGRRQHALRRPR